MNILFVDDSPENLRLLQVYFRKSEDKIEYIQFSTDAVERIKEHHFDILFFDIQMPEMDGFELLNAVKGMPTVEKSIFCALTAAVAPGDEQTIKDAGFDEYLTKPIMKNDLFTFLENKRA